MDTLIKNATLWASATGEPVEGGSVLVRKGRLARVGTFETDADRVIDAQGRLLMPGLIQGHIHLCQALFRGVAEDLPLLPWLRNYIWPLEAHHDPDSLRASALLACAELIRTGTTAFLSMETVRHTEHVVAAVEQAGLMGIVGHCFMDETSGYDPLCASFEEGAAVCDALLDQWGGQDRIRIGVAPRFALSCTGPNMTACADYARDRGLMLHTHSSEQEEEVARVREQTGLYNIEYLHSLGLTGPDVGIAHCVHTQEHEREILKETGTRILHCPSANLKLGSGTAPIPEYLEMGLAVSLGADGAPCNNRLDAFLEMREAGLIQKPRLGPDSLPAVDVVRMATELGAVALGWQEEMGTLEEGKRANLILVEQQTWHCLPNEDPATNLVYSNEGSDVYLTMVDGQVLYQDGVYTTIDEEALRHEVKEQRRLLMQRTGLA